MRKSLATLVLVFAFAAYGLAWQVGAQEPAEPSQNPTAQQPSDQSQRPMSEQHSGMAAGQEQGNSITGCLTSSGGEDYALQTSQGNVQLKAEDDVKEEISKHVGQEVRILGEWAESSESSNQSASNRDRGAGLPQSDEPNAASQGRTFSADRIDVIEQTCTTTGMQQSPSGMNPGAPPETRGPENQTPNTQPQPQPGPVQ